MKIIKFSVLALSLSLTSFTTLPAFISKTSTEIVTTIISWTSESIDVGNIPQGIPKVIVFEFKNNADKAIVISNAQGSCGCTATDYSKEMIAPGKSSTVKATFNAANKGVFSKTVTVTTSAEKTPKVLTFKGIVD